MIITVIGGSGSGKSEFAEDIAQNIGTKIMYFATMENSSDSSKLKIARHIELRKNKNFVTVEKKCDINEVNFSEFDTVILECISNLLANEMFENNAISPLKKIISGIKSINSENVIIVTNNIFCADDTLFEYSHLHGLINQQLASMSDAVYEVVCGIPIKLKGD